MTSARKKPLPASTLILERAALLAPLASAASIAWGKLIPILGYVLLESDGSSLRFTGSDLDMWITHTVPLHEGEPVSACIEAGRFSDLVRRLPDGADISLEIDASSCSVKSGGSRYVLPMLPVPDFPKLEKRKFTQVINLSCEALRKAIEQARSSMSADRFKPMLGGIHLRLRNDAGGSFLCVEATDGYRVSRIDSPKPEGLAEMEDFIIPRAAIEHVLKLLSGKGEAIIEVDSSFFSLTANGSVFRCKLVDGVSPDVDRVIPTEYAAVITIDKEPFTKAIERLVAFNTEKNATGISINTDSGDVLMSIIGKGSETQEVVPAEITGAPGFGVNPRYLLDAISQVGGDGLILDVASEHHPVRVRSISEDGAIHIIMPMRR